MSLSYDDVERAIRLLDNSHFDELTLEMDGIKLELRRHGASAPVSARTSPPIARQEDCQDAGEGTPASKPPAPTPPSVSDLREITAPMLGTFYRAPKPGAEPYARVGDQVEPDDPIGIIEVMKLMNAISAGLRGEIVEILAQDGELVEYQQPLMRVRPA